MPSAVSQSRIILTVATLVVVLDQATKALAVARISLHARVPVVDGYLALTHVRNRGMAFGLFNDVQADWLRWALAAVALVAVAVIWSYAREESAQVGVLLAFGGILGGALGNLIDRVRLGYVIDFILAHWGQREWPAFNVADSAITMGGVALFLTLVRDGDPAEPEVEPPSPESVAQAPPTPRDA